MAPGQPNESKMFHSRHKIALADQPVAYRCQARVEEAQSGGELQQPGIAPPDRTIRSSFHSLCMRVRLVRNSVSPRISVSVTGLVFAGLTLAPLLTTANLRAQTVDWNNTSGTPNPLYHQGNNWSGGAAPGSNDKARFNHGESYEVRWNQTTASTTPDVGFLEILAGDVTFLNRDQTAQLLFTINGSGGIGQFSDLSISGVGTSLTNRGLHLHSLGGGQVIDGATLTLDGSHAQGARLTVDGSVGFDVSGNLNVQSGAIFDNTSGLIGRGSNSMGIATVTGSGSQWNGSNGLFLGGTDSADGGVGTLNIADSGNVNVGDDVVSTQTGLTISDTGTNGKLWVRNGSTIENEGFGRIGGSSGTTGIVTVTGTGSQWNNLSNLRVGNRGDGTLNVEAGGLVTNADASILRIGSTENQTI